MNTIVTVCPTMTNPDKLHSVQELRAALHQANSDLMGLAMDLSEYQELAAVRLSLLGHNVKVMVSIIKVYKSGDRAELDKHLAVQLTEFEKVLAEYNCRMTGEGS